MARHEAAVVVAAAGVTYAVASRSLLAQQLLLAARAWLEARAGALLVVALVMLLGLYQVTAHVFHPVVIAMFGGKPKVVLTQDRVTPPFSAVREVFLRNVVKGRSLAVQCVVLHRGELAVDLCGAPEPITVSPPPPPSREGVGGGQSDDEEEQACYEWATDPDAYHPHAVQPVWGASCALAALAAAIAVDRGWLDYDKPVSEYWPAFPQGPALTVAELLREADLTEAGPVALAVLLEKVDPHKRTLAVFVQEELSNKLQLGGGLRHASSVHPADSQPDTDQRVPAQSASRNKDDTASGSSGKLEAKAAKPAVPKSQEEWQAAAEAAARSWFPLVDLTLTEVPAYKLELCAAVAAVRGWHTELPPTPRPARGGWLANGRSLALIASMLAHGGRSTDGVVVIRKETLSRAERLLTERHRDKDTARSTESRSEAGSEHPQQLMGMPSTKTMGGWVTTAVGHDRSRAGLHPNGSDALLVGSAGFNGGFFAWSASLGLGVGVAAAGEFPHCMADDSSHPMRLLANAILAAAEEAAEQHAASTAAEKTAAEE